MTTRITTLLLDRLRTEGVVPATADAELRRVYAGRIQREQGAWSWSVEFRKDGWSRSAGSQWPMRDCVRAERWLLTTLDYGDICIDPVPTASTTVDTDTLAEEIAETLVRMLGREDAEAWAASTPVLKGGT